MGVRVRSLLAFLCIILAAPAHAEWWEARTDNFIVYSESSEQDARKFAERLERFDQALRSLQNIQLGAAQSDWQRVTVFRTGNIGNMGQLAGAQGIAGFYVPRHGGPVAFTPVKQERREKGAANADRRTDLDPQTVLFHEYSHHFMFRHFTAAYPSWYVEGFAEAYSTIDLKDDGSFHLGNAPQSRGATFDYLNYSIQRMLLSTDKPDAEDFYARYSYGWLLTHYLTFKPSRSGQLQTYLKLFSSGADPGQAARTAFGDLGKLERDVRKYLNERHLPGADVRPANYQTPAAAMRRLDPDEEAIMRVRMRSKVGVTRKNASDVAGDARAVAEKFPQSVPVLTALAEAELETGNLEAAERAADAALALKPDSVEAMIYKARTHLDRGRTDPSQNFTAREWLAKAHKVDPAHPSILYYNYRSYLQQRGTIPESAIIGLEQSFLSAPYDHHVRLTLTRQLLSEHDGRMAKSVLASLVQSPHESKSAKALRKVYDKVGEGKLDEAYKDLVVEIATLEEEEKSGKPRS
jgi:Flp pilus assembly protein TadD